VDKYIAAAYWDAETPVATLLNEWSGGFDRDQFVKLADGDNETARKLMDEIRDRRSPDRTYIHVITNGAGEVYETNDNGDYFNWTSRKYKSPLTGKEAELDGGLVKYHQTYKTHGAVYCKHKNSRKKDPETGKPYTPKGKIEAEATNPKMKRGELIISVKSDDPFWVKPLEKLGNGEQLYWSMGTSVPFDICSECLHKAKSRKEYCEHLKEGLGGLTKEGRRIKAINDRTLYHDISKVDVPAFIIAQTLGKVASRGDVRPEIWSPKDENEMILQVNPARYAFRRTLLEKLAKLEKTVAAKTDPKHQALLESLKRDGDDEKEIADKMKGVSISALPELEKKFKVILPSRSYMIILIRNSNSESPEDVGEELPPCLSEPAWLDLIPGKLDGVFSRLLADGSDPLESHLPVGGRCSQSDVNSFMRVLAELDKSEGGIENRILKKATKFDKKAEMHGSVPESWHKAAEMAADEYARHQLDVLELCPELMELVILQNKAGV